MSASSVPFNTQAAVLDRYVHLEHPETVPTAVDVIVRLLGARDDLRRYFFRNGPTAGWAHILWDNGFFATPPAPQEVDGGLAYPIWDVQEYLITVAKDVPETVLRHVHRLDGPPIYIAHALHALRALPPDQSESALPRIATWLQDPVIADVIAEECWGLMQGMAKQGRLATAFDLFRWLVRPAYRPGMRYRDEVTAPIEAIASSRRMFRDAPTLTEGLRLLREQNMSEVIAVLENALQEAEELIAQASRPSVSSWWRSAIEDTGHDLHDTYRDTVLRELRVSLEEWIERAPEEAREVVNRYLHADHAILRRLALHLIRHAGAHYNDLVATILADTGRLDDVDARHELFLLLKQGFPNLSHADQHRVTSTILSGPPADATAKLAEWVQRTYGEDPENYAQQHRTLWVRDRLWMIRDHLPHDQARELELLVAELGQPDRPELTRRSEGGWIQDVGPLNEQELAALSPSELMAFVLQWEPPEQSFTLQPVTHAGLAQSVAHLIATDIGKYTQHLHAIARQRPEYAYAILEELIRMAGAGSLLWDLAISLCQQLLADEVIRLDTANGISADWTTVRLSITRLLRAGLERDERVMPLQYLPRCRDVLLLLVDDPDPDPQSDNPPDGALGHGDPATVALNHVRPTAMSDLVVYALRATQSDENALQQAGPGPQRLDPLVREALTRRLDRREEKSQAVHSVYGRYLPHLFWLDKQWVEEHIQDVLPSGEDEESRRLYAAAWDSYVIYNSPRGNMLPLLRPKYERAIHNLALGYVTMTHMQPVQRMASHILAIYLYSDEPLTGNGEQQSLIRMFFDEAPAEARGSLAWVAWRTCEGSPSGLAHDWPKIRALWEWRVQEAIAADHSADFDVEIGWFAHLLPLAAKWETIVELWPLLEGMLPHITRSVHQRLGREPVEQYVRVEVERDPVRTIQLYRLLHDQEAESLLTYWSAVRREIIEIAAADERSRRDALALIDTLSQRGDYQYQDIYDRYAG